VVIGGGISGLAAAWFLVRGGGTVTVLERSDRAGGCIRTLPFAGLPIEAGPDAFVARSPAGVGLASAMGLAGELVAPATSAAYVWSRGRLRPLPEGIVLGVPTDVVSLARSGVVSPAGVARAALDAVLPTTRHNGADTAVGALVRSRMGPEVNERLVDPLLGGINAGHTDHLSLTVAAPQLAIAARHRSLMAGARSVRASASDGPVFLTVRGGLGRLVDALVEAVKEVPDSTVRFSTPAIAITRAGHGWRVTTERGDHVDADAVVVAVPATPAAALLGLVSPTAAAELTAMTAASVVLVTLAYPRAALEAAPRGSGFLVPRVEGRLMTACSWVSWKWPHLAPQDATIVRVSSGRAGDTRALELDDDRLVARLHGELVEAVGARALPTDARVHRWVDAFPQFEVGHLERVGRIETALAAEAPGVLVAGAPYRGVGIPTCIAGAEVAAGHALAAAGAGVTADVD
jgi:oxygen-dependent protoporphyrinogen oxidase